MTLKLLPLVLALWAGGVQACQISTDSTFSDILRMERAVEGRVTGYERRGDRAFLTVATDEGPVEFEYAAVQYGAPDQWYGPPEGIFVLQSYLGQPALIEGICSWGPTVLPRTPEGRAFLAYFRSDPELTLSLAQAVGRGSPISAMAGDVMAEIVTWHTCELAGQGTCARPAWRE